MTQKIIYPQENGVVSVITPMDPTLTVEDIALKDVPPGVPYIIVDADVIPTDRTFRDAWEADFSSADGFGIGHDAWVARKEQEEVSE